MYQTQVTPALCIVKNFICANKNGCCFFYFSRWLVLTFKREFSFEDALTMFEIISSQHLELTSMEAERERERQRAKQLEIDG